MGNRHCEERPILRASVEIEVEQLGLRIEEFRFNIGVIGDDGK